jgi:hypothetical protein
MTKPQARITRAEWGLWLGWVLATTVGWVVGFALCEGFKDFVESFRSDGAVIGVSIGIAQWLVLTRRINHAGWWVLASTIGFAVGKALADGIGQADAGAAGLAVGGAAIGASIGIAQWLVLRRHVEQAAWWVLATVAAWAVGWSIASAIDEAAGGPTGMSYLIGASGSAAAGIITGFALAWLLRQRRE